MTPLLTPEKAAEIAHDYATDIVADVEERLVRPNGEQA